MNVNVLYDPAQAQVQMETVVQKEKSSGKGSRNFVVTDGYGKVNMDHDIWQIVEPGDRSGVLYCEGTLGIPFVMHGDIEKISR